MLIMLTSCTTDPDRRALGYVHSGEQYFKAGKFQEAAIEFRNAVQIAPRSAEAHYQLARAYRSLKNSDGALRELTEATTLNPADSHAQLDFADLLIGRGQVENARSAAEKVLQADPNNARAHAVLGEAYGLTHHVPYAIQEFQKAIDLDPAKVEYYTALAVVHLAVGQPSAAETVNRKAVDANPKSFQAHLSLGQFYLLQGKLGAAEAELRNASYLDARAVPPRLLLARICTLTGRRTDAEKILEELKKIAPDDPQAYQALGLFYASIGNKEAALTEFRSLTSSKPKDASVKLHLLEVLIDLKRIQEADAISREILHSNAGNPQALLLSGRILLAQGKYTDAVSAFQQNLNAAPKSAGGYYFLGIAQQALGSLDLAKSSFARAHELDPGMTEATVALANLDVKGGDQDEAIRLSDSALKRSPDSASAYVVRARAVLAKGNVRQGEALLHDALKRDPSSRSALAALLKLYMSQSRTAEAMRRITELVQRDPNNAGLHFLLAVGYFSLKDLVKSEASIRRAIALDANTTDAYTLLANIDFANGATEQAKRDLQTGIDMQPSNSANYIALGAQYEREGKWDEAKRLFERAHAIAPNAPLVAAELAYLYIDHGGDVNVALSLAETAKLNAPDSPAAADVLGWAYVKLGSPGPAVPQLEEAVQKYPKNVMYRYHLGMAYVATRRFDAARMSLETALKQDLASPFVPRLRAELQRLSTMR